MMAFDGYSYYGNAYTYDYPGAQNWLIQQQHACDNKNMKLKG